MGAADLCGVRRTAPARDEPREHGIFCSDISVLGQHRCTAQGWHIARLLTSAGVGASAVWNAARCCNPLRKRHFPPAGESKNPLVATFGESRLAMSDLTLVVVLHARRRTDVLVKSWCSQTRPSGKFDPDPAGPTSEETTARAAGSRTRALAQIFSRLGPRRPR
jgi:hypothetical protein